jgi:hypothetical protein
MQRTEMRTDLIKTSAIGLSVAVIAGASLLSPALAAHKHHRHSGHYYRGYSAAVPVFPPRAYARAPNWTLRNMNPYGTRCVSDLGYGRYEYCDW